MTSAATERQEAPPISRSRGQQRVFADHAAVAGDGEAAGAGLARFLPPLAFLIVSVILICAVIGYTLARQIDERHQEAQREQILGAIAEFRAVLADVTLHLANDVAAMPTRGPQSAGLAQKLAPFATSRYRYAQAFVIDAAGRPLAAYPAGEAPPPAVMQLVETLRADADRGPDTSGAAPPHTNAAVTTDFVRVGNVLALAAVATAEAEPDAAAGAAAPVLATVLPLDARLIGLFEKTIAVDDLTLGAESADPSRTIQSLLDRRGRIVGSLSWTPQQPVMAAVMRVAPLLAIVAACFIAFAALAFQQARREKPGSAGAEKHAHEDALTGLADRARILEILDRALAARLPEQTVMFAFLALDGFKDINDSFGHRGGDFVLAAAAARLKEALPASAMVGRMGGDEFAVVMTVGNAVSAVGVANAAMNAIARPFEIANQTAYIGASVGLTQAPRDGDSRDELMRRTDLALRAAKRRGHGNVVSFALELEQEFHDRRFIMRGLRRALAEDGLELRYQPIVAADSQRIVGVEALLRWQHRTRGAIPPEVFVPIAEQAGMMSQLGEFVLRRAFADAARWKNLYIAVNLSPLQVRDPALVDLVATVLRQTGTPAARVVLEITEGVLIDEPERAIKRLDKLRALGVKIALDDFGSGYSSLRYLQRFPIDKLKIDKSFVEPLGQSERGGVIIQAVIALGRALGVNVLVEGVESEEQRVLLRLAGCDEMQGHLFSKPLVAAEVDALLAVAVHGPMRGAQLPTSAGRRAGS